MSARIVSVSCALDDELIGDQQPVSPRVHPIEQPQSDRAGLAVFDDFDRNAGGQQRMKGPVVFEQVLARHGQHGTYRGIDRCRRRIRVECRERAAQLGFEDGLPIIRASAARTAGRRMNRRGQVRQPISSNHDKAASSTASSRKPEARGSGIG